MFDYKLLMALATVVEQEGFERAALTLGLSQSAISQRIKLLEARLGEPVLLRQSPPVPTAVGQRLLNHIQQVRLLEGDLKRQVPTLEDGTRERLRVALNADSLATWWAPAVSAFCQKYAVLLDQVVEDQDVGLKRMRAGEVAGCLCGSPHPVAGARAIALGAMRYRSVASPAFIETYLDGEVTAERLAGAPAIVYGPDDRLQHRFMAQLGFEGAFYHHLCPSSEGFFQMTLNGLGWGLLPELQAQQARARGDLVDLLPEPYTIIDVPLYWHHWRNGGEILAALTRHLIDQAGRWLVAT
ncbi:LysR family transcriptional regulator (chromosome initiation inhibitor) [Pseudomonas duriflava]|uniref:LysR family transcriptional regulator (Chromosome initiation inhibitor) n=1 Tax=Pseudomonas duriflava TaxID=459528 RepID=A0A562QQN4_9PSED|nr:LysR family transcriptional regulator ArgP [Pseudomonas duriflava]TWI58510.1 LysR family transcriptional regulator (chromosome initiation inhibitor) [Pseudomonas duriflava]